MITTDLLIINFEEIRRRSIILWESLSPDFYFWRPDKGAMTLIEGVRHVLQSEHEYYVIFLHKGAIGDYKSPWENRPYSTIQDEIAFAGQFREDFLSAIRGLTSEELENTEIIRSNVGQRSMLGRYLLKAAYHEAVHAGQFLSYLRSLRVDIPLIWD
jgi:uncharacterized damage-inducible protein DinB